MKVGLLINPIAGMGGRVGLKGTDGVVDRALALGAKPIALDRAKEFVQAVRSMESVRDKIEFYLCPGDMGELAFVGTGIECTTIGLSLKQRTTADDTKACVKMLYAAGVRLLVFVGGDGTARDISDVVSKDGLDDLLVIGVPSGVKMYSGVFVVNPRDAAEVVRLFVEGSAGSTEFEIMDADEESYREDRFVIRLYGFLRGPSVPARFQGVKQASPETVDEHEAQEAIAKYVIEHMIADGVYILGPGTTVKTVADMLGIKKTTLGVDVYTKDKVVYDVNEDTLLGTVRDPSKTWIIVSPIGHQGMLFGRGNQQISPKVIDRIGRNHILVICTPGKLRGLESETLKVDTGQVKTDEMLRGYIRVITDYNEIRLVKVE